MIKRYGGGILIQIPDSYDQETILEMKLFDSLTATGRLVTDGFILKAGSLVKEDNSMMPYKSSMIGAKTLLMTERKLIASKTNAGYFELSSDIFVYSPNAAMLLVLGRVGNAHVEWKDKNGRLLDWILTRQ